jgi:hypothetical protein
LSFALIFGEGVERLLDLLFLQLELILEALADFHLFVGRFYDGFHFFYLFHGPHVDWQLFG